MPESAENSTDELDESIGPDVDVPGPYPTADAPNTREAAEVGSHQSGPATTPRQADSLGDLTKDVSTSEVPNKSGGMGVYDDEERQEDNPPKP
jgi:hypothetical protein